MAEIKTYPKSEFCAECGGACCKNMACHFSPTDFETVTFDYLKSKIEEGWISIDWWENDEPEYFLRVRHVGAPVVDPSWGGKCILFTPDGCPLPFEKRPLGARALKPNRLGPCTSDYGKYECKEEWKPYSDILKDLVSYFEEE